MTRSEDIGLNPSELAAFYAKYFSYYNTLDSTYQALFIERALTFINDKVISGAEDFDPDNRVKAIVTASAVQLTLGLETWKLDYFENIELHPSDFDAGKQGAGELKYSGETNLQGYIKLSWKSFLKGYQVPDDNLNLGLHEFSHALRFNGIRGNDQDYFVNHYFDKWLVCAYDAFYDIKNGKPTIFRRYGGANINEFLSVCIEHYFESPGEIKEKYPLLYYATGILLNQDVGRNNTRIGIRQDFMEEQNKLLEGLPKQNLQTEFIHHWTSKLCLFVAAMILYCSVSGQLLNPVTWLLCLVLVCVYLMYDYNAVKIETDGQMLRIEKGALLFRKRKQISVLLSQLISLRQAESEWSIVYYNAADSFFYDEKLRPPKGVNVDFLNALRRNKTAVQD